jgi:hypothetical protein
LYGVPGVEVVSVPPSHRSIVAGAIAATLGDAATLAAALPPVLGAAADGALDTWEGLAAPPQAVTTTTRVVSSAAMEALGRRRLNHPAGGNVPSNSLLLSVNGAPRGCPFLHQS